MSTDNEHEKSNISIEEEIKERLINLRKSKGITQDALSEEFNKLGYRITRLTISRIESGNAFINYEHLIAYCKYFKTSSDYLLGLYKYSGIIRMLANLEGISEEEMRRKIEKRKVKQLEEFEEMINQEEGKIYDLDQLEENLTKINFELANYKLSRENPEKLGSAIIRQLSIWGITNELPLKNEDYKLIEEIIADLSIENKKEQISNFKNILKRREDLYNIVNILSKSPESIIESLYNILQNLKFNN